MIFNCCKYDFLKLCLFITVCIYVSNQPVLAQTKTIDSLKKILPFLKGTSRIDCLNELGSEFSDRYWSKSKYQQTDTALMYTLQAETESQQLHYLGGIGKVLLNRSLIEEEHDKLIAAEDYVRKALPILQKENMQSDYHRGCVFLGWILHNRGFFEQSIQIYKQELPYYQALKDSENVAKLYRVIARAYDMQGNSGTAFTYFQKDFAIQKKPEDAWGKRSSASLKALVYLAAGDTANAVFYYKQAPLIAIAYSLQKKYDSALMNTRKFIMQLQSSDADSLYRKAVLMRSYSSLIEIFFSLKKFDSVIIYGRQLISFFKKGDKISDLMPVLRTVASSYHLKNENDNALFYANQLLAYAQSIGARPFVKDAYQLLWHIYQEENKINVANDYQLKYLLLNDSLEKDKYISQSAAWKAINDININEANYKNMLKINEERSKAKIEYIGKEKKTQLYVFITAITLIGLFIIMIVRNNGLKRKKDQLQLMMTEANMALEKQKREQEVTQLQQQKTELELQALRAQMNPHFIFNCLNSINRFIINNEAVKAADYLTKFAKLIRIVLEQSGKSFVPLEDELKCLQLYMDLEALRFEIPFQYKINCNGTDISSVMVPTLLMQPFVENAIWHGLQTNCSNGKINIDMHLDDKILHCKICDNGIGIKKLNPINQVNKKSLGIKLTQQRLQLISNNEEEIKIEMQALKDESGENAGTCVDIKIPVVYS